MGGGGIAALGDVARRWRPWIAAVLQSGVNVGVLLASCATFRSGGQKSRAVFLVGVLPALLVFWIRREVPETDEWTAAKRDVEGAAPGIAELFRGEAGRTAVLVILVCSVSLTAHWAFIFWYQQHLRNLPDVFGLPDARKNEIASTANALVMSAAILGNFVAAAMARVMGYRRAIALLCLAYFLSMVVTYSVPRSHTVLLMLLPMMGAAAGCLHCSRCTCRRCFRFCCGRPERAFATTSAALPQRWERSYSGSSRRWATTGSL